VKLDFNNISDELIIYEAFGVEGNESEALNDAYLDLFELVGKEAMIKIYKHCNGDKLNLPKRLYRQDFVTNLAQREKDRRERAKISRAAGYSVNTIEELLDKGRKKKGK